MAWGPEARAASALARRTSRGFAKLNRQKRLTLKHASKLTMLHKKLSGIGNVIGKNHPMYKIAQKRSARVFRKLQSLKSKRPEYFVSRGGR